MGTLPKEVLRTDWFLSNYLMFKKWRVSRIFCKQEHVNKVDEDAGCIFGISCIIFDPFVKDQDHKVAKQCQ